MRVDYLIWKRRAIQTRPFSNHRYSFKLFGIGISSLLNLDLESLGDSTPSVLDRNRDEEVEGLDNCTVVPVVDSSTLKVLKVGDIKLVGATRSEDIGLRINSTELELSLRSDVLEEVTGIVVANLEVITLCVLKIEDKLRELVVLVHVDTGDDVGYEVTSLLLVDNLRLDDALLVPVGDAGDELGDQDIESIDGRLLSDLSGLEVDIERTDKAEMEVGIASIDLALAIGSGNKDIGIEHLGLIG